ncbi:related to SCH9-serine/threonine protein kinase involved in stress response and nutrient-sensing signaling pathway [Armillaria ostoyae]|uniref:Related to SCH9-serine/threonine protein kinase involved in stress response and nutrient-sensing signaling pathway n=1 Tax=Armillaria ostoyae TaxID=47428 RepID=A0A284QZ18_ARMOS|nr:related to SCH9-serine/threonine protein kinase involved in stress response and nutrient-sensing signaling pathway [Armillaria ostoyae]
MCDFAVLHQDGLLSFYLPTISTSISSSLSSLMIKLWPTTATTTDTGMEDMTPRPGVSDRNPFDTLSSSPSPAASCSGHTTTGPRHPLLTPNHDLTPGATSSTPALNASFAAALPPSLSLHAFNNMQLPSPKRSDKSPAPPASTSTTSLSNTSKGQIHVKLIQARGLNVLSSTARPYVVVQFEQNEFVSRDPTDEADKEVKGVPISRVGSGSALSALAKASGNPHPPSPSSSVGSRSSANSSGTGTTGGLFGRVSSHNPVWKHEVSFDVTSEASLITFNVYDRSVDDLGFLGTVQIKPVLIHEHSVDQWYKLLPFESEVVSGEMRVQITFEQFKVKRALTPRDFEFLKLIGRGTFGKVFQVRKKDTKRIYAMKVLSKKEIVAKKEVAHTIGERKILQQSLESPFLVGLKFSFQTDQDLYLVTDFKSGGELFWHLQRETRFPLDRARFYIAELVLALEHLHKYDIVYRDLKPENILLDATGHVALCDFGLSKADLKPDELTTTFCGTTEYLAPEILLDEHGYSKIVDFWSLGVLLFEMCCGWSPFYAEDTQQMYKNICFGKIRFPKGVINEEGKQFVKGLLNRNPKHRLGATRDAAELKEHTFFSCIDWKALSLKQVTPPFKPVVESDESTANFDPEFTTADLSQVGVDGMDENDPSEDWVMSGSYMGSLHTPNGPLGSERNGSSSSLGSMHGGFGALSMTNGPPGKSSKGVDIKKAKTGKRKSGNSGRGSPLTSSVQEKFRGFSYSGGESLRDEMEIRTKVNGNGKSDDEGGQSGPEPTTEDEYEDFSRSAGRYARGKRRGLGFTEVE